MNSFRTLTFQSMKIRPLVFSLTTFAVSVLSRSKISQHHQNLPIISQSFCTINNCAMAVQIAKASEDKRNYRGLQLGKKDEIH